MEVTYKRSKKRVFVISKRKNNLKINQLNNEKNIYTENNEGTSVVENKKVNKETKLFKYLNEEDFIFDSLIYAIDNENLDELERISKSIEYKDVIFEMYCKELLTNKRLLFIVNNCSQYLIISSLLINTLISRGCVSLLDIIFSRLSFYDKEFILKLLFYYKNRNAISISTINQQMLNEKYYISTDQIHSYEYRTDKYLFNECMKKTANIKIVKFLIKNGVNVNGKEFKTYKTPLNYACLNGNLTLIKFLIQHGANVNNPRSDGETPLFDACKYGNVPLVKLLLELGAYINKKNVYGRTPIFFACNVGYESLSLVKILVEHGASLNIKDDDGETILYKARLSGNIELVKYLTNHGAI